MKTNLFHMDLTDEAINSYKIAEMKVGLHEDWSNRMEVRKNCEKRAKAILDKPTSNLEASDIFFNNLNDFEDMGALNLLNVDSNLQRRGRFGQQIPNVLKYLFEGKSRDQKLNFDNLKHFKQNYDLLTRSRDDAELEEAFNSLIKNFGIFTPTLILYLRDSDRYNIMTENYAKEILILPESYRKDFHFYSEYNDFLNKMKAKLNLLPQEMDLVLFWYKKEKLD